MNITYDVGNKSADCACTKFKSLAIPCQHMLAILKEENVFEIPESYVHKRFTKEPKDYAQLNRPNLGDEASQLALRHGAIQLATQDLFKFGILSAESCTAILSGIKEVVGMVRPVDQHPTTASKIIIPEEIQGIKDPGKVKFKGCAGKKGKNAIKTRKCTKCGNTGHYANSGRCPPPQE
ncbi:hypothetical protein LINPERHAP2_LOCUS42232 [Linum perenne]